MMSNSIKPKQAKIVKLKRIQRNSVTSSDEKSFESTASISQIETEDFDVSGEYLTKLYVIKNYRGDLIYGDLSVEVGDHVYFISESEFYYFVENKFGIQGFLPKETCVDLDEIIKSATTQSNSFNLKTTSV